MGLLQLASARVAKHIAAPRCNLWWTVLRPLQLSRDNGDDHLAHIVRQGAICVQVVRQRTPIALTRGLCSFGAADPREKITAGVSSVFLRNAPDTLSSFH